MTTVLKKLSSRLRDYRAEQKGAAAVEFAMVLSLLIIPVLNVVDFAMYAWDRMQVDNAAQMGAQAAWATCIPPTYLPASTSCSGMGAAITKGAQSTSLNTAVTVNPTTLGYYCVNSSNALVSVGTYPGTKPADCNSVGSSSDTPGEYVKVSVSYTYTPIFPAVSIVNALTPTITRIAWMRLG